MACPLPALCHKEEDIADLGLNTESAAGLDAFNVLLQQNFIKLIKRS